MPPNAPMDALAPAELRHLAQSRGGAHASLFMPTHRAGKDTREDPIRLKNLLKQAEEKLTAAGTRSSEARMMLDPARALIDDPDFWRHQSDGLAIFISSSTMQRFRVPLQLEELAIIGERFHLKPLFPLLTGDGLYYVLAVSQNELRLLRCMRSGYEEIESPILPEGEDSILRYIEEQKQLQWHTQTGYAHPSSGSRAAVFHGQGAGERHDKDRIFEYFRLVATAVHNIVDDVRTPVVFVGVDYLFPIFEEANLDLNLLDNFVRGNPDEVRMRSDDLHHQAWGIVEPYFAQSKQKAIELYRQALGTAPHRAANDLGDALRAAHDGRVSLLFTARNARRWGRYDAMTGQVEVHENEQPGDEELLDLATIQTFIHRGTAYVLSQGEMPDEAEIAAVTRY